MARARVVLVGGYGFGNLGDDALLVANVRILQRCFPADEIAVFCNKQPYLSRLIAGTRVISLDSLFPPSGDLLVYGGGTQFCSFPLTTNPFPRRLVRAILAPTSAARFLARRLFPLGSRFSKCAALGMGLGPFEGRKYQEGRARSALTQCQFVSLRDPVSCGIATAWGCANSLLGGDVCFIGELWGFAELPQKANMGGSAKVAVVVRSWPHTTEGAAFIDPLLAVCDELRRDGISVAFVSFCAGTDGGLIRLLRQRGQTVKVWTPGQSTVNQFVQTLSHCELVVTARYHGAVAAAMLGKPVICIEVEQKLRIAALTLHSERYLWRQPFVADQLRRLVCSAMRNRSQLADSMSAIVEQQRAAARRMVEEFVSFCGGGLIGCGKENRR